MHFLEEDQSDVSVDYFIEREDSEDDSEDDCEMESTGNTITKIK